MSAPAALPVVLIVEDDPIVRDYAALVFADDVGCPTIEVASADAAIQAIDRHPEITTAFIDVLLAGDMNGIALASLLNISYPHIRIILTSGTRPARLSDVDFIAKPWDVDELRRLVGIVPAEPAGRGESRWIQKHRAITLLVEDDVLYAAAVQILLEEAGYHVRTAGNGARALAGFAVSVPDLLVTDLEMPEMDGAALIRTVLPQFPDLPIVILSASAADADRVMAEHPGALIRYVPKLAMAQRLLPAITELLSLRRHATMQTF